LAVVAYQPGAAVPKQTQETSESFAWVASGAGVLKVGNEEHPFAAGHALFVPSGQPSAMTFTKEAPTQVVHIFAPAGPEQQFKMATGPAGKASAPTSKPETKP